MIKKKVVISRFSEPLDWVKQIDCDYIIFNKGNEIEDPEISPEKIINVPNQGREAETFLRYICENYLDLSDFTIFVQGNPFDHWPRTLEYINSDSFLDPTDIVSLGYETTTDRTGGISYPGLPIGDFQKILVPSGEPEEIHFTSGAQFIVPKKLILNKSLSYWKSLRNSLEHYWYSNIPSGYGMPTGRFIAHVFERLWPMIYRYSDTAMYEKYDYVIIGSGLFGAVFAREMTDHGKTCLIVEKRNHIGGNCYTENRDGINVHVYGPHIFHTNDKDIWDWVSRFCDFLPYKHSPKVRYGDRTFSFPINLMTLNQLWGVNTPGEAKERMEKEKVIFDNPKNLEEWALSQIGTDLYEIFIKGYTEKQWGRDPKNLPASIIKRLPIRTNFDDNYFFDKYQGIPEGGYTGIFDKILDGIEVITGVDYFEDRQKWDSMGSKIVYTGKIDEFFNYKFGELEYRTLEFKHQRIDKVDFQGCSIVNYTSSNIDWTRITEHKHFENSKSDKTWITMEFPKEYKNGDLPLYPIGDDQNMDRFGKYKKMAADMGKFIFGGRLAEYRYYDMHQIIASALTKAGKELAP